MNVSQSGRAAMVLALALASCRGLIDEKDPGGGGSSGGGAPNPMSGGGAGGGPTPTPGLAEDPYAIGPSGLRRLTRTEYDSALRDLLGDASRPGFARLPEDVNDPFDNNYKDQLASGALIESVETLAEEAAARALADPARRSMIVGCTPTGPGDAACLRSFITSFGRRALRRPLAADEIQRYLALQSFSVEAKDFYFGVSLVLRAMLQDPEFLYQVEIGKPVPGTTGVVRLTDHELASRLSFFLLGTIPTPALQAAADAGQLSSADQRLAAGQELLRDPRGRQRIARFHALWLGYHQLPFPPALVDLLRAESDALVEKVTAGKTDYLRLFLSEETLLTPALAQHYGLPSASGWTPYGASPRRGILSHGTVLAVGGKFDDTSPTLRGVFVRSRLLCEDVPPPPPNVDVDQAPKEVASPCKYDRYAAHRSGGCAACHNRLDPVGFGLENYDRAGKFRAADKDAPACAINGDGTLEGVGDFNGPAQLAELLIRTGDLESCVVRQLYRFAMARHESGQDGPSLDRFTTLFKNGGRQFDRLLLDVASSGVFAHKRVEP
jgi:hypothetical protein